MDTEKVGQLLLTEEEQLAKTTIRKLQRTIENQAVTEKILKDELKALQNKLSQVGGLAFDQLNADIEELRADEGKRSAKGKWGKRAPPRVPLSNTGVTKEQQSIAAKARAERTKDG